MKSGPLRKPKYQPGEVHHNNNLKIIIYKGQFPKPKYQGSPLAGDVSTCPAASGLLWNVRPSQVTTAKVHLPSVQTGNNRFSGRVEDRAA